MEKRAAAIRDMPKINSVSERIMMEKYLLEGETAEDRLTRPIGQIRQRTLDDIEKPTFKPTIKKISSDDYNLSYRGSTIAPDGTRYRGYNQELDDDDEDEDNYLSGNVQKALDDMHLQNFNNNYFDDYSNGTPMPREYNPRSDSLIPQRVNASKTSEKQTMKSAKSNMYDRTVKWEEERQRRLERERMQREKEQEQQYSFKPKLENYARVMNSMYGNSATMSYDSGGMSIAERNELWVKEREKKLEKERQKKAEEAVKDCSFTPNITPLPDYLMDEKAKVERAVTKSLEDLATNAFHFKKFHEVSSPAQEDAYDDDDDENEKEEVDCGILPISKRIPLPPRGTSYAQPTHVGIESNFDNRINTERLVAINPRNYNTTLPNPLPPPAPSVEQSQKIPIPYKSYKIGGSGVTELSASNQQSARVDGSVQGKQFSIAPRVLAPSATNTSSYYKSNSLESILDGNQAQCAPVVDDDYYDSVELAPEFDLQSLANKKLSISPCRTAGLVDSYRSADNGKGIGTTKTTSAVSEVGNIDAIRQRFSSLEEPYY